MQLRVGNGTQLSTECRRRCKATVVEQIDGSLTIGQGHHLQSQFGLLTPTVVAEAVDTHTVDIERTAVVGRVQGHTVDQEAQVAVVVLLHNSEDRTVAGLYTVVCPTAIEGTGEAVCPVLADEAAILGPVLLTALNTGLVEIIGC